MRETEDVAGEVDITDEDLARNVRDVGVDGMKPSADIQSVEQTSAKCVERDKP